MILGLTKISKELKKLEPYGYHVKNALSLVQSDNKTDSVVYTSRNFQPYAESFSGHYEFVGPSVFSKKLPDKNKDRPLIYISMGTVINDRPDFYGKCIEALKQLNADVIISYGNTADPGAYGKLPDNIKIYPYVDQLEILSKADVFITHCGMNSVSESLYMSVPMVLYPQTGEQFAVARRTVEIGAGILLTDDTVSGIRSAVNEILSSDKYGKAAEKCSTDFRSCAGAAGAADFIENAPHSSDGTDVIDELNISCGKFQAAYWTIVIAIICLVGSFISWKYVWIIGFAAGIFSLPMGRIIQEKNYRSIIARLKK